MLHNVIMKVFGPRMPIAVTPSALDDRRRFAAQAHGPKREWRVTGRRWSEVTGICLHQTACLLGERDPRWDNVGCHVGITRGGRTKWLHDFNRRVAHGNGWNARCVGIEIDGLYAGVEGDIDTVWDDPSTLHREQPMILTAAAIEATCNAIRWIFDEVEEQGGRIGVLGAHRQSSMSRRSDPGSAIWQAVALPIMAELGLSDGGVGFEIGGRPIPESWDARAKGIPY